MKHYWATAYKNLDEFIFGNSLYPVKLKRYSPSLPERKINTPYAGLSVHDKI